MEIKLEIIVLTMSLFGAVNYCETAEIDNTVSQFEKGGVDQKRRNQTRACNIWCYCIYYEVASCPIRFCWLPERNSSFRASYRLDWTEYPVKRSLDNRNQIYLLVVPYCLLYRRYRSLKLRMLCRKTILSWLVARTSHHRLWVFNWFHASLSWKNKIRRSFCYEELHSEWQCIILRKSELQLSKLR